MPDTFLNRIRNLRFLYLRAKQEKDGPRPRRDWAMLLSFFAGVIVIIVILGMILSTRAKRAAEVLPTEAGKAGLSTIDRARLRKDVEALARLRASFDAALNEAPPASKATGSPGIP